MVTSLLRQSRHRHTCYSGRSVAARLTRRSSLQSVSREDEFPGNAMSGTASVFAKLIQSLRVIQLVEPEFSDRRRSYVAGAFLRREVRNRTSLVYRHRRLLENAHHRAKHAAADVEGDRARNGAGSEG